MAWIPYRNFVEIEISKLEVVYFGVVQFKCQQNQETEVLNIYRCFQIDKDMSTPFYIQIMYVKGIGFMWNSTLNFHQLSTFGDPLSKKTLFSRVSVCLLLA